eukprot:CAMPEP_0184671008 /NCGR_PEP_ID=MMETSP0308-20130426/84937_1 /TAXON_ID=38269 /ORGANISM="Gloeochaete witrockiana, Strain SAG 46.84" /LENGTH=71 /DNA_ID=CAMNT_0027118001 /DNA_START=428 /DNA_END=643 /DNA_ORIENTATION=+
MTNDRMSYSDWETERGYREGPCPWQDDMVRGKEYVLRGARPVLIFAHDPPPNDYWERKENGDEDEHGKTCG